MEQASNLIPQILQKSSEHGYKPMSPEEYEREKAELYNQSAGDLEKADGYNCNVCKNKGYIATVQHNDDFGYWSQALYPCKCQRIRSAIHKLNKSGLKNVVKEYTFDKYQTPDKWQEHIKQTALRFCQDGGNNWFFIGGQSGAGKSHICTAIAVTYIKKGYDTHYMLWLDEMDRIKSYVREDNEKFEQLMKRLKETPVLYIDDLFKAGKDEYGTVKPPTPSDIKRTFEIINHRYNNPDLVTIISSERTLAALLDIDEATAGRIAERTSKGGYFINLKNDKNRNWRFRGLEEI